MRPRQSRALPLAAAILMFAIAWLGLSPKSARAASAVSHNVAYVFDDSLFPCVSGCGMNDTVGPESGPPGGSLFTNAMGFQPGSGNTGEYTPAGGHPVNLTNVRLSTLDGDPHALSGFDTVILYQTCNIGTSENAPAMAEINSFLNAGGKIMIFDGDGCSPHGGRGAIPDWSGFALPFETDNPGPQGAPGSYFAVEPSTLTAGLGVGPVEGDAVGDANIFTTFDPRWFTAIEATNVDGVAGKVEAYAETSAGGLALYSGEDFWFTVGPSSHLQTVFDDMLGQPWNPDNLPSSNPSVGRGPVHTCTRKAIVVGVVGVCADMLVRTGATITGTGHVTLDGGVSVGEGPISINPAGGQITTPAGAPLALLRSGGVLALGSASVAVDTAAATDPTSGKTGLAKLTLNSISFGPLASLRVGGLPFSLPSGDGLNLYLDSNEGGGLVGTGMVQLPKLGGLAPSGSGSLGLYAATPSPVVFLGGSLHVGSVSLAPGWSFDGLDLSYQQPTDTWTASGGLTAPIGSLQASGSVVRGALDSLHVSIGGQDVPLGDSGFFFTGFGGGFSGLVNGPLKIDASTEGFWGVPKAPIEPFYLDNLTVTVDLSGSVSFDGAVSFLLKDHSPVHGKIHLKLNLHPFSAVGSASAEGELPGVSLKAGGGAGFTTKHFTAAENGSLKIFGLSGSGQVIVSDAGMGASGKLCAFFFCKSLAFAGTWKQIGSFDIPAIVGGEPRKLITVAGVAAAGRSAAVHVPAGRSLLLVSVTDAAGAPALRVRSPDGQVYSSTRSTRTVLFTRQPQFGLTTIAVVDPQAGLWRIGNAPRTRAVLHVAAQTVGSLELIHPDPIAQGSSSRHPLGAHARVLLKWGSANLPRGVRVTIVRRSHPHELGVGLAGNLAANGEYLLPVSKLAPGRNYLTLAAALNGVPFEQVNFLGQAWRAAPHRRHPAKRH